MEDIKTFTVKELEPILKVQGKTIRRYINAGDLKARKYGKSWIINEKDLQQFMKR